MTTPKLDNVTLRAGTRYYSEGLDGVLSGERILDEDTAARVITLGPVFNVYEVEVDDGNLGVILVDVKDEVR